MPNPLSQQIRENIIYHKQNGAKNDEIVKWLRVSKGSVKRIWRLYKEEKSVESKPHKRGRTSAVGDKLMNRITVKIKEQPDITLAELIAEFALKISISALSRKLRKEDLTFKKRRYTRKNSSARMFNGFGASG
jgi:transposase